jgi:hypothetical protein
MNKKWEEIKKEELEFLFYTEKLTDQMIADKYNVTKGKVSYKRRKFGISIQNQIFEELKDKNSKIYKEANEVSKQNLLENFSIDQMAKAITVYSFRNGPIEDMHANNQLSDADMKTLNKHMANKLAGFLEALFAEEWLKIEKNLTFHSLFTQDWDITEPEMEDIDLEMIMKFISTSDIQR